MPASLDEIVQSFRLADAFDIAVATVFFAAVFQWMRQRSGHALLLALIAGAFLYLLSNWLRMYLTLAIFRVGLTLVLFGLIVIFQKDLRHAFEGLAARLSFRGNRARESLADTLIEAAVLLSREKTGGLIVLPRRQNLDRHLKGGVELGGRVSVPLLLSLFHSGSIGHDGAVVLRGNQVERFGVHLPLSSNFEALGPGGTRHAAALGLAEQSDALVLVVSEERGTISIAHQGQLHEALAPQELADRLNDYFLGREARKSRWERLRAATGTGVVVLSSLLVSGILWYLVAYRIESVQRVVDRVPIDTLNVPEGWVVDSIQPENVRVNISGSKRAFSAFDWKGLTANVDLANVTDGISELHLGEEDFRLPEEMAIVSVEPDKIHVTAYRTKTVELPVEVKTTGRLPEGLALSSLKPDIETIEVRVRVSQGFEPKSIPTEPIDLAQIDSAQTKTIPLDYPEGVWPTEDAPQSLSVEIQVTRSQ